MDPKSESFKQFRANFRKALLAGKFCNVCFGTDELLTLDEWIIDEDSNMMSLRSIWSAIFNDKPSSICVCDYICLQCRNKLLDIYKFIKNVENNTEAIQYYVDQVHSKVDEIDAIMADSNKLIKEDGPTYIVIEDFYSFKNKKALTDNEEDSDKSISDSNEETKSETAKKKKKLLKKKLQNAAKECPECFNENCVHKKYIDHYIQTYSSRETVTCPDCEFSCCKLSSLLGHVNKVHLDRSPFICERCAKLLPSKNSYENHLRAYHTSYFKCTYCDKEILDKTRLDTHEAVCKSINRKEKCKKCPASFDSETQLRAHEKKHQQSFPCDVCNRIFCSKFTLEKHIKAHSKKVKNSKKNSFSCPLCKNEFRTMKDRNRHIKEHVLICSVCELKFDSPKEYKIHLTTKHDISLMKRFKCESCNYTTDAKFTLEAHVNRYHLKIAPHECSLCFKRFTDSNKLRLHMKTHKKLKEHLCPVCNDKLCNSTALKKHMRLHTGERPYKCETCGEGFVSASIRNTHVLKTHEEKSVKCPLCTSMFYTLNTMRMHFKKTHWKSDEPFDVTKVKGLKEEDYDLFRDRRMLVLS